MKYLIVAIVFVILLVGFTNHEEIPEVQVWFCPNCITIFEEIISNAKTLDCAFYELNPEYKEMFSKANLIIEKDNKYKSVQGENVEYDQNYALMHNKFCIINNQYVLTGSTNPTENGLNYNNNNMLLIKSKEIAKLYQDEFENMQDKNPSKRNNFQDVEIYFCPEDNCQQHLIEKIRNAKESIYFAAFSFTDKAIATELLLAIQRNVTVKGIFEKRMQTEIKDLLEYQGAEVYYDDNPKTMHHKFFIIDNTTWTGSYNPTNNGNLRNNENVIVINNKDIGEKFILEFYQLIPYGQPKTTISS